MFAQWSIFISIGLLTGITQADELQVLVFGDSGTGQSQQYQTARAMEQACQSQHCQFALMLGDNIYENGLNGPDDPQLEEKFERPFAGLDIPFYPVLGNHDIRGDTQAQIDYSQHSERWTMPARYYDFKIGSVHFFALDTNLFHRQQDIKQRAWLEDALIHSTAKTKIVFGHHAILSDGSHGDHPELIETLLPLVCEHADAYLAGHDHDLQLLEADCGLPLVVSGAVAKSRRVKPSTRSLFSRGKEGFSGQYGFVLMGISPERIRFQYLDDKARLLYYRDIPVNH